MVPYIVISFPEIVSIIVVCICTQQLFFLVNHSSTELWFLTKLGEGGLDH